MNIKPTVPEVMMNTTNSQAEITTRSVVVDKDPSGPANGIQKFANN